MGFSKRVFTAIWLIANLVTTTCAIAEPSSRAVLIVDDSDPGSPFSRRFRDQVYLTLSSEAKQRYAIYSEYFDLGHFGGPDYDAILSTNFRTKYRDKPVSAIIAFGGAALNFSLRMRAELWPSLPPIVFAKLDDTPAVYPNLPLNVSGTSSTRRFHKLIESAQLVVPNLARIALVGAPLNRQPFRSQYEKDLQELPKRLNIVDLTGLRFEEVKKRIAALPGDAVIAYLPIYSDDVGNPSDALKALANVANRPIVVDSENFIGLGATGGFVLSAKDLGQETAHQVARILNGESASNVPIAVKDFSKPVFDFRQLKRWDISENTLPVGSDVRFREFSAWDLYRWQIIAIALTMLTLCLIIVLLLIEHRRRIVAERESHQHLLEATQMDRAMTASAMSASIGHELAQPLAAILSNAETAEMLLGSNPPDLDQLREILADIRHDDLRAADIIKHLRMLLKHGEIDRQEIDVTELVNDTVRVIGRYAAERGVSLEAKSTYPDLRVRADRVHIQQVLMNLAMNAIDAMKNTPEGERKLKLRVSRRDHDIMISIEDTGPGISDDKRKDIFKPFVTTKKQGTGLGLSIAQTIVGAHGGRIWAENSPKGGAIFHFTLGAISSLMEREADSGSRV
jgi:signal transduction histidine kinase